jgi:hypothetical protein
MAYSVVTVEVDEIDENERKRLYRTLVGIPCMRDGYGVAPSYVRKKLRVLKTHREALYGNDGGVMRAIRRVYLLYQGPHRRSATSTVVAFAVVCDTVEFHRLRPEHVPNTVYLALLCGTSAWRLVSALKSEYVDNGVGVTMDALSHTIAYYHNPSFGVVRMIDTEAAFRASGTLQKRYASLTPSQRKETAADMLDEIERGDSFTRAAESAFQDRSEPDYSYLVAHLVMWPEASSAPSFARLCVRDAAPIRARRERRERVRP